MSLATRCLNMLPAVSSDFCDTLYNKGNVTVLRLDKNASRPKTKVCELCASAAWCPHFTERRLNTYTTS